MKGKSWLTVLFSILLIFTIGCGVLSNQAGDPAAEVGEPVGPAIEKDIGPGGGAVASQDGRLTLTVPPNALTETIAFSIQPITNKAGGGIGLAYRLEPDGKTFTTPLEISFRYDDKDLEGTIPEALSLAYQDQEGAWRAQTAKLNQDARTLTISTAHFTDFASLARLRMSPAKATLSVGESQVITLIKCKDQGFIDKLLSRPANCSSASLSGVNHSWQVRGEGTIASAGETGVIYTAPSKKPTPNTALVVLNYDAELWDPTTGKVVTGSYATEITIVDRGYKVTGQDGPVVYSGVICSLEKPFEITGTHPLYLYPFKFVPSSATAGTASYRVKWKLMSAEGSGSYTVEGADSDTPRIVWQSQNTGTIPVIQLSGSGPMTFNLVPLETDECN